MTTHLEKVDNFFKLLFHNLSLYSSFETILVYFRVFITPLVFSMLKNYYFESCFNLRVIRKMT